MATISPMVCSAIGGEKIPLGLVSVMPDSRSSGYINCETPAAVECTHLSLRARRNCSGRSDAPMKMSVSGNSCGRRSKSGKWTTRISGQRAWMVSGMIGCARHCSKGCQTQIRSLVSAGLVRFMMDCWSLFASVEPCQEQAHNCAEAKRPEDERLRYRNRKPGDDHQPDRNDRTGFRARHR